MLLGALDKAQVQRGAAVLDEIKAAIAHTADIDELHSLSSKFYTTIPHSSSCRRQPVICVDNHLQERLDMLDVPLDIESAVSKVEQKKKFTQPGKNEVLTHPRTLCTRSSGRSCT